MQMINQHGIDLDKIKMGDEIFYHDVKTLVDKVLTSRSGGWAAVAIDGYIMESKYITKHLPKSNAQQNYKDQFVAAKPMDKAACDGNSAYQVADLAIHFMIEDDFNTRNLKPWIEGKWVVGGIIEYPTSRAVSAADVANFAIVIMLKQGSVHE